MKNDSSYYCCLFQRVEEVKEYSPHCVACGFKLAQQQDPTIKHFGLQLLEHFIKSGTIPHVHEQSYLWYTFKILLNRARQKKQINRAKKGITKHTHKHNNKDM